MPSRVADELDTQQVAYIPDHRDRAIADLLSQYRGRPRIAALAKALAKGAQLAEDAFFDVLVSIGFGQATGATLDRWGEMVGEERGGLSDADYRPLIEVRIFANNTYSDTDALIYILQRVTAPSTIREMQMGPAGAEFHVLREHLMGTERARRVARLLNQVRPAGVAFVIIEARTTHFGFEDDAAAEGFDRGRWARVLLASSPGTSVPSISP